MHSNLVGRGWEAARVDSFLAAGVDGPARLLIEGEPGIGKTALFELAVGLVTAPASLDGGAARRTALVARCTEAESTLAYAGLADLFDGIDAATVAELAPPQRRALDIVRLRSDADGQPLEPRLVGRATLEVLRRLASAAPVLISVDDAQWLDPASTRALLFALRRVDREPISLLTTRRWRNDTPAGGLPDGLLGSDPADRLGLGPVPARQLRALLHHRFPGSLPRGLLTAVLAAAGGNPLYAIELVAAHLQPGRPADEPLRLPPRLEQLLADRLAGLPDLAAAPLAAVACTSAPTVASIVGALGADARSGLDAALDAGVLTVRQGRLAFTHPLLSVAAVERLRPSLRRRLYGLLAGHARDAEERAWLRVRAADGPDAAAAHAAEEGAEAARARGAPEVAALLTEAAVRLTPTDDEPARLRRLIAAAYHRVASGDVRPGRAHMTQALDLAPIPRTRGDLRWRLAMLTHLDGDTAGAISLMEAARADAGDDRSLRNEIDRRLAGLYGWQGRTAEAVACWRAALAAAEATGDRHAELETRSTYGMQAYLAGAADPRQALTRITELLHGAPPAGAVEEPATSLGVLRLLLGEATKAVEALNPLYRRAAEHDDDLMQAMVGGFLCRAELAAGNWHRAETLARDVAVFAQRVPATAPFAFGPLAVAMVDAFLGNTDTARHGAQQALDAGRRHDLLPVRLEAQALLGFVDLSVGDAVAAHAHLGPVLTELRTHGIREPLFIHTAWSDVDALVELGDLDTAAAFAEELWQRGEDLGRPLASALGWRARGLVRGAAGDLAAARSALDAALTAYEDVDGWPFERARTLLTLGAVLRRSKQKRAARDALELAQAIFDQLGARLWSARTSAELARIGGRAPTTGALTSTERRVAALVAAGRTNQQAASELFLSTKTVAAHLTSVYAKLGVRSRVELARQFREHPP